MINYRPELPKEQTITIEGISVCLYVVEDNLWLLSDAQVAKAYGISINTVRQHCNRNKDIIKKGTHWFYKQGKLPPNFPCLRLWTKEGLIELGNYIKTTKASILLKALGVKSRQRTKIESEYLEIISSAFKGISPYQYQYEVQGYKIDLYFPELKIAVEIDEHNHGSYDGGSEALREFTIKQALDCNIIKFNPNVLGANVGELINLVLVHYLRKLNGTTT